MAHTTSDRTIKTYVRGTNGNTLEVHVHARDDDGHLARAFKSEYVGFLPSESIARMVIQLQFWPVQNKTGYNHTHVADSC